MVRRRRPYYYRARSSGEFSETGFYGARSQTYSGTTYVGRYLFMTGTSLGYNVVVPTGYTPQQIGWTPAQG